MQKTIQEDIAVVKKLRDDKALIEIEPSGGCDKCGISGICGAKNKKISYEVENDLDLEIGQKVKIEISSGLRVASSLLLFLAPILMMIAFYFLGKLIGLPEEFSIVLSFLGLLLSGVGLKIIDKKLSKKLKIRVKKAL